MFPHKFRIKMSFYSNNLKNYSYLTSFIVLIIMTMWFRLCNQFYRMNSVLIVNFNSSCPERDLNSSLCAQVCSFVVI